MKHPFILYLQQSPWRSSQHLRSCSYQGGTSRPVFGKTFLSRCPLLLAQHEECRSNFCLSLRTGLQIDRAAEACRVAASRKHLALPCWGAPQHREREEELKTNVVMCTTVYLEVWQTLWFSVSFSYPHNAVKSPVSTACSKSTPKVSVVGVFTTISMELTTKTVIHGHERKSDLVHRLCKTPWIQLYVVHEIISWF